MIYNTAYGRLINNSIEYAPKNLQIDGVWYIPASNQQLIENGYYELVYSKYPSDDKQYEPVWEIEGTRLIRTWVEIPDSRTPAEKREAEYENRLCVVFPENSNELITIDAGVKLVYEYSCENTESAAAKVTYLKEQITEQKAIIREEYPDE